MHLSCGVRLRLSLALAVIALAPCMFADEVDMPEGRLREVLEDANTRRLLFAWAHISEDGRSVAFVSDRGEIGRWDATSRASDWRSVISPQQIGGVFPALVKDRLFALAWIREGNKPYGSVRERQMLCVDVFDLKIAQRWGVPMGPMVLCQFSSNVFGLACYKEPSSNHPCELSLFRLSGDTIRPFQKVRHSAGPYDTIGACRVRDDLGLLHVRMSPRGPKPAKEDYEACVVDINSGRILERIHTAALAGNPLVGSSICVSAGGTLAFLRSRDLIEVRELPSLALSAELKITEHRSPPVTIAVSHDGRYVAFGIDQVEVWDTVTGKVRTLHELNSRVARSKGRLLRGSGDEPSDLTLEYLARLQYCLMGMAFIGDRPEFATITHDGEFALWDAVKGVCVRRDRVAKVMYLACPTR